jgi:hypothetical protein
MSTPASVDHAAFAAQLEESIAADTKLIEEGQAERKLIQAGINDARERVATNQRLLKALQGPVKRTKKAPEPEVVESTPDVLPDEPEVAPFKLD